MYKKCRRLIAVITLVAVAASALWVINSEVLFDGMTAEIAAAEHFALNVDVGVQASDHEQSMPGQTCNHGCHAASHLIGLFENTDLGSNTPQLLQTVALGSPNQHDNPFLQGPYRPPLENPLV
jgi:hypothetical protein